MFVWLSSHRRDHDPRRYHHSGPRRSLPDRPRRDRGVSTTCVVVGRYCSVDGRTGHRHRYAPSDETTPTRPATPPSVVCTADSFSGLSNGRTAFRSEHRRPLRGPASSTLSACSSARPSRRGRLLDCVGENVDRDRNVLTSARQISSNPAHSHGGRAWPHPLPFMDKDLPVPAHRPNTPVFSFIAADR